MTGECKYEIHFVCCLTNNTFNILPWVKTQPGVILTAVNRVKVGKIFFFFSFSNLMTKDDWKKLGYSDDETVSTSNAEQTMTRQCQLLVLNRYNNIKQN